MDPWSISKGRARSQLRDYQEAKKKLPVGHPYALVPKDTPFWIAQVIGSIHRLLVGEKKGSERSERSAATPRQTAGQPSSRSAGKRRKSRGRSRSKTLTPK